MLTLAPTLDSAPRVAAGSTTGSARRRKRPTRLVREVAPPSALEATKARVRNSSLPTCTMKYPNANSRSVARRPSASVSRHVRLIPPSLVRRFSLSRSDRSQRVQRSKYGGKILLSSSADLHDARGRDSASRRQHSYRIAYHPDFFLSLSPRLSTFPSISPPTNRLACAHKSLIAPADRRVSLG